MLVGQAMRDAGRFRTGSTIWLTLNCLCFSSSFSSHNLVYTYLVVILHSQDRIEGKQ